MFVFSSYQGRRREVALLSKGRNAGTAAMKPAHRRRSCRGRARPSSGQAVSGRARVHVDVCVLQLSSDFCCLSQGSKLEEKSSELWKMLNVDRGIKFTRTKRKGPTLRKTVKRGIGSVLCGSLVVVTVAPFKAQGDAAAAGQQAPALRPCPSQTAVPARQRRPRRTVELAGAPRAESRVRDASPSSPLPVCECWRAPVFPSRAGQGFSPTPSPRQGSRRQGQGGTGQKFRALEQASRSIEVGNVDDTGHNR